MTEPHKLDQFDRAILRELVADARATQAELASRVHLSSTAVARRQKLMEDNRLIAGYHAEIDLPALGFGTAVTVLITLANQSDEALTLFERQVAACPSVATCVLLSGSEDYLITLHARDLADFERIHREELSTLPGVARMRSLFTLREVVRRDVPPALFPPSR